MKEIDLLNYLKNKKRSFEDISYAYAGFEDEFRYYDVKSTSAIKKLLREALVSYIVKQTGG